MTEKNRDLASQMELLERALLYSPILWQLIEQCEALGLPEYYIGAGCIAQTVWNRQRGNDPLYGIDDVDIVYFDRDASHEGEDEVVARLREPLTGFPLEVDVKNQARVHLWYRERFGREILPYGSVEEAINTWPTTASAVGVRLKNRRLRVYAPYGLGDLFAGIVRPNKLLVTEADYLAKAEKWKARWPDLAVFPW